MVRAVPWWVASVVTLVMMVVEGARAESSIAPTSRFAVMLVLRGLGGWEPDGRPSREPVAQRPDGRLRAVVERGLAEHVLHVLLHRLDANLERIGNLVVRESVSQM